MEQHRFLVTPGRWLGEGNITIKGSDASIRFFADWVVKGDINEIVICKQRVEMFQVEEHTINNIAIYAYSGNAFKIEIENDLFGKAKGKGLIEGRVIRWEFQQSHDDGLCGVEEYTLQDNGDYHLHAEYYSDEIYRTTIKARLWLKSD